MNKSCPPLEIYVHDKFLFNQKSKINSFTKGTLISVRALQNQALQFSVLLETGALFTGLPAQSIVFNSVKQLLSLDECQMWNCISSDIDIFTSEMLQYMKCRVFIDNTRQHTGIYLFSIDFVGKNDLSRHPVHWKQFHAIKTNSGHFIVYPQYRIRFLDDALCLKSEEPLPKYKANEQHWLVDD